MPKRNTLASQVTAHHRLLSKALRAAKALLTAAASLGVDAPRRRRRRKRKAKASPKSKAALKSKKGKGKTHLTQASEEEE